MNRPSSAKNSTARRAGFALVCALVASAAGPGAFAEFALVQPAKDATILEDQAGALANGSGEAIFSGRINSATRSIRRALLAFDVAGALPPGSTVTGATLWLHLSSTSAGPVTVRLLRVVADWGEGPSVSGGGGGVPAQPGDATWLHRFYSDVFWSRPGGDFDPIPRAEAIVDQPGSYIWGSTPGMIADLQAWLDDPASAYGWILIGDESRPQTVKRFDSRESPDEALRPLLEVDYVPPCAPDPRGPGYWERQCSDADLAAWVVPCAQRYLADLGLPDIVACEAVLVEPPPDCRRRAERKLAVLLLNVCAGRMQTSCPIEASAEGCEASTVGDLLLEISRLIAEGDCRAASGCGGSVN